MSRALEAVVERFDRNWLCEEIFESSAVFIDLI